MEAIDRNIYNYEAEDAVLGSFFLEPDLIKECKLKPEDFSPGRNFNMYWTLKDLDRQGIPIDVVSVSGRIGSKIDKVGGIGRLIELSDAVPSTANFKQYCKIVEEHSLRRKVKQMGERLTVSAVTEDDPNTVVKEILNDLMSIEEDKNEQDDGEIQEALMDMYSELESATGDITGIPSGIRDLDRLTGGYQDGDLIIVGGRPSMGKTAVVVNKAIKAARGPSNPNGDIAVIFSLEMPKNQLIKRMAASLNSIDLQSMKTAGKTFGDEDWKKLNNSVSELSKSDIKIFDKSGIDVGYIWAKCRKLKRQNPGRRILVIIDYLQLIQGDKAYLGNRTQEISDISRMLKGMARTLGMPVIALSQLSRGIEQRQDKRPMMSDLRESGQIEQDADIIEFLYREDYYDKESENKNILEIIIAKHRNGPTGVVSVAFVKEFGKIVNIDWSQHQQN